MPMETYLIYLAAVAVFFATPPDTSQLLIVSNSIRFGLRRSVLTIAGGGGSACAQPGCCETNHLEPSIKYAVG